MSQLLAPSRTSMELSQRDVKMLPPGTGALAARMGQESAREARRTATRAGTAQHRYKSDAWLASLLVWHARALDRIALPWCTVVVVSFIWTCGVMARGVAGSRSLAASRRRALTAVCALRQVSGAKRVNLEQFQSAFVRAARPVLAAAAAVR